MISRQVLVDAETPSFRYAERARQFPCHAPGYWETRPEDSRAGAADLDGDDALKLTVSFRGVKGLALLGDPVDNIPGIQGVGGKTAAKLLSVCNTIEDIATSDLEGISLRGRDAILQRIRDNLEGAKTSRELARIRCDVDIDLTPNELRYRKGHPDDVIPLCKELGFDNLLDDIPLRHEQPGLFD